MGRRKWGAAWLQLVVALFVLCWAITAAATVNSVSVQSPFVLAGNTTNLTSPVHFQATAEGTQTITGYVVYIDDQNVYRNFSPSLDAWVALPAGQHKLYVKAWDASSHISSSEYEINITGFAPPTPPNRAHRLRNIDRMEWTVDNNGDVGGACNDGSIADFRSVSDPNTNNAPAADGNGLHIMLRSSCQYSDSLFYRKFPKAEFSDDTNFLWDFWFYVPTTTDNTTIQALEFDMFQAVPMSDGVREFMFGSQCNYASNQWQFWLPKNGKLTWVDSGVSPCKFSTGVWHHATYFLQRVTSSGFQEIPLTFSSSTDTNSSLRFGTLTIDGNTVYLGTVAFSKVPNPPWNQTIGVQHQLDSKAEGVTIEEYVDGESLTSW